MEGKLMGYTHYFTTKNVLDADKFKAYSDDIRKVVNACHIPVAFEYDNTDKPPQLTSEIVRFNGLNDAGHETFLLNRTTVGFEFCKTAYKPYDIFVVAALAVAKDIFGDDIDIGSNGTPKEWSAGVQLAGLALGRTINNPIEA